jgi:hypothetical protein
MSVWPEVSLPGAGEREAAAAEFRVAWSQPEHAQVLAHMKRLAGPRADLSAAEARSLAEAVRSVTEPESAAVVLARRFADAAIRTAYSYGPRDRDAVMAQLAADQAAERERVRVEAAETMRAGLRGPVASALYVSNSVR